MNAGRILQKAGYDSDELRVRLTPVDPDRVNVWPASRWMVMLWRKGIRGVTVRNWIFVDAELMHGDPRRLARLVIHELVHVRQFREKGYLPFALRYIYEYLRGLVITRNARQAYLDISAEREARAETESLLRSM